MLLIVLLSKYSIDCFELSFYIYWAKDQIPLSMHLSIYTGWSVCIMWPAQIFYIFKCPFTFKGRFVFRYFETFWEGSEMYTVVRCKCYVILLIMLDSCSISSTVWWQCVIFEDLSPVRHTKKSEWRRWGKKSIDAFNWKYSVSTVKSGN